MQPAITRRRLLGVGDASRPAPSGREDREVNMCGVLVHVLPQRLASVRDAFARIDGVAVHQELPNGRLVVTVEDTPGGNAIDALGALHAVPGVVAAALVYHQFEAASVLDRREETRS